KGALQSSKTVLLEKLLAEAAHDPDYYVFCNENSNNQLHGLPFDNSCELCYIYPRRTTGAVFLVKHTHWHVGRNVFISQGMLASCFDPANYLAEGYNENGKAYRHVNKASFDLRCCHMQILKKDEITVDTLVNCFASIFTLWNREHGVLK